MRDSIAERLEALEEKIDSSCRNSGRNRSEVRLLAVTKFHPIEAAAEAWKAGVRLFGENRVREAKEKYEMFDKIYGGSSLSGGKDNIELHLIGSLQRNKAKAAVELFDCIQSVDRDSLIDELGILTAERENPLMVLLEYHTGEETKAGFPDRESLYRAAEKIMSCRGLLPLGLMTMAPFTDDKKRIRSSFRELAAARNELKKRFPVKGDWSCLSMGMTNDFEIAIEEGSTLIRIGTAIFGERRI